MQLSRRIYGIIAYLFDFDSKGQEPEILEDVLVIAERDSETCEGRKITIIVKQVPDSNSLRRASEGLGINLELQYSSNIKVLGKQ